MWAVESGRIESDIEEEIIYYYMAKKFGFPPEVVDRIDNELVQSMIFIDAKIEEKENKETKHITDSKGSYGRYF
jgi:hypothetical protein